MRTTSKTAIATLVFSMIIFGTIGIFRRAIPLPSEVLAFARGIMGSVFLLLVMKATGRKYDWSAVRSSLWLLILTGGLIGANWIMLFEAYNYTSVATATLCYYMQPVIVILASPLLLKERITLRKTICAVIAVIGMILVSGVTDSTQRSAGNFRGILLGLGAAALYASVVLINKKMAEVPVFEKTILQLSSASIVLIPYMLVLGTLKKYPLGTLQTGALLTVGILHTGFAYALYFGAISVLPAQTSALLSYIDPVTAVLLSAMLLREPMSVPAVIGAILIIGSAMASELRRSGD